MRELQRQITSSLYQRLALSRDKDEVRRLSREGHVVEKAADLIKNPLVLEFLGLEDRPHYSEEDLESETIDQLESFLLELGKDFLFEARQKRFTFDNEHFRVAFVRRRGMKIPPFKLCCVAKKAEIIQMLAQRLQS